MLFAAVLGLGAFACASDAPGDADCEGDSCDEAKPKVKKIVAAGNAGMQAYMSKASVWSAPDLASLTPEAIMDGPKIKGGFTFDQAVTCKFNQKESDEQGGATPKFACDLPDGDTVKVKYGNAEVHSEAIVGRLFWVLGFGSDGGYPVRVTCEGCPADIQTVLQETEGLALIERKLPGMEIIPDLEQRKFEGWTMAEYRDFAGTALGSQLAPSLPQIEALQLLQAFVQHGDCKPDNQRMLCADGGFKADGAKLNAKGDQAVDTAELQHCTKPMAYVHDLGASMADGKALSFKLGFPPIDINTNKLVLSEWSGVKVFKDDTGVCRADLGLNAKCGSNGGVIDPVISESGRKFLLERIGALSDAQLRAIFAAGRLEEFDGDDATIDQWIAAFKAKVDQIKARTCTERPILISATPTKDSFERGSDGKLHLDVAINAFDTDKISGNVKFVLSQASKSDIVMESPAQTGRNVTEKTMALVIDDENDPGVRGHNGPHLLKITLIDATGTESRTIEHEVNLTTVP